MNWSDAAKVHDSRLRANTDFKFALVLQKLKVISDQVKIYRVHQFSPEPASFGEESGEGVEGSGISNAHRKPLTVRCTFWLSNGKFCNRNT